MKRVAALLLALALAPSVACGPTAPHAVVLPVPPPQAVLGLNFLLVPAEGGGSWAASANDAIEAGFAKAGYKISKDPHDPHDAVIVVGLSAREKPSAFTFYRDGQRIVDLDVRVTLTVKDESGVVDLETHEHVASGGQTDPNDGLAAVNALSDAIRFKIWAMKLVAQRAAPAGSGSAPPDAAPAASASAGAPRGD